MELMADEGIVSRAGMIQELVVVRDGLLCMSTDDFTHNDVLALIEHLCLYIYTCTCFFLFFFLYFCVTHVRFL